MSETKVLNSFRVSGTNFDVDQAQCQFGGRILTYGYFHYAIALSGGSTADGLNLTTTTQNLATTAGLGQTVITNSIQNGSLILNTGVVGGIVYHIKNLSTTSINVYPPSGGAINNLSMNTTYTVASGTGVIFVSRDNSSGNNFVTYP